MRGGVIVPGMETKLECGVENVNWRLERSRVMQQLQVSGQQAAAEVSQSGLRGRVKQPGGVS